MSSTPPWLTANRADWEADVRAWLEAAVGPVVGFSELKARPWSVVWRVAFFDRTTYFKACGAGGEHEVRLLPFLSERWPNQVPGILALDIERKWILMADEGPNLRSASVEKQTAALLQLLPRYAEMQIASMGWISRLTEIGLPDRRLSKVSEMLEETVVGSSIEPALRAEVFKLLPTVTVLCEMLAHTNHPLALEHADLHTGNMLWDEGRYRLCDWGDSCLAHPFCSIGVTFKGINPSVADRLTAAYLEPWSSLAPHAQLMQEFPIARWITYALQALNFTRMFSAAGGEHAQRWMPMISNLLREWVATSPPKLP